MFPFVKVETSLFIDRVICIRTKKVKENMFASALEKKVGAGEPRNPKKEKEDINTIKITM